MPRVHFVKKARKANKEAESAIQDKDVDSLSFGNVGWDFS